MLSLRGGRLPTVGAALAILTHPALAGAAVAVQPRRFWLDLVVVCLLAGAGMLLLVGRARRERLRLEVSRQRLADQLRGAQGLYGVVQMLAVTEDPHEALAHAVRLIPAILRVPALAAVRIETPFRTYSMHWANAGAAEARAVPLQGAERLHGTLSIAYRSLDAAGLPRFTSDEELLFKSVAAHLSTFLDASAKARGVAESERYYRSLIENSLVGVVQLDRDGKLCFVNERMAAMVGWSRDDLLCMRAIDLMPAREQGEHYRRFQALADGEGEEHCYPLELCRRDGAQVWVMASVRATRNGRGEFSGAIAVMTDISELCQAQEALRASEARFRRIVENGLVGIGLLDPCARLSYVNDGLVEKTGHSSSELVGRSLLDLVEASEVATLRGGIEGLLNGSGKRSRYRLKLRRRDGAALPAIVSLQGLYSPGGNFEGAVAVLLDVSELERTARALAESEVRFRRIVETSRDGACELDAAGRFAYVNGRLAQWLDEEPSALAGRSVAEFLSGAQLRALRRQLAKPESGVRYELPLQRAGMEPKWLLVSARPVLDAAGRFNGAFAMLTDISPQKRAVEQLGCRHRELEDAHQQLKRLQSHMVRTEKLASLGQLAAGVAHEINNPMGYLKSNLGTLESYFQILDQAAGSATGSGPVSEQLTMVRADLPDLLADCREGVARVEAIVRGLRGLVHSGDSGFEAADLHEVIEGAVRLVWNELKYHVRLEREFEEELPSVECRSPQLHQVLVNLLVNAAHAINGQGRITLRTLRSGEVVHIQVEDTGCGIPPDQLGRVFDPFFTTKRAGEGTGLGLSVSYGIIQGHGGQLEVSSTLGKGSCFTITLPIRQRRPESAA